jgi:hypothetical protein
VLQQGQRHRVVGQPGKTSEILLHGASRAELLGQLPIDAHQFAQSLGLAGIVDRGQELAQIDRFAAEAGGLKAFNALIRHERAKKKSPPLSSNHLRGASSIS